MTNPIVARAAYSALTSNEPPLVNMADLVSLSESMRLPRLHEIRVSPESQRDIMKAIPRLPTDDTLTLFGVPVHVDARIEGRGIYLVGEACCAPVGKIAGQPRRCYLVKAHDGDCRPMYDDEFAVAMRLHPGEYAVGFTPVRVEMAPIETSFVDRTKIRVGERYGP